jgi:hypothetical protein
MTAPRPSLRPRPAPSGARALLMAALAAVSGALPMPASAGPSLLPPIDARPHGPLRTADFALG